MTITPRDACGQRRSPLTTVPPAPVGAAAASVGAAQAGSEEKTCTILALRRLDAGHDAIWSDEGRDYVVRFLASSLEADEPTIE